MVDHDSALSGRLVSGPGEGTPRGDLAVGASAGDYVVTELIARGGCGSVYRTRDAAKGRVAAVKVLHGPLAGMPKMVERFSREVRVVNMLRHPSIVEIYDIGTLADKRPWYAMEYLPGRTLSTILDEQGRMAPIDALEVMEPVCGALSAAHAAGVIHRDVKASNIMIGRSEGAPIKVKLLDFGIAKLVGPEAGPTGLTSEGRQVGTLTIMAPEQLLGGPVDARIDIYALGVLLFRMLTGRLPFDGKNAITLAQQHLEEPAPRPSQRIPLSPSLDALVLRCLEKRPERRYETVDDLLDALRRAVLGARRARQGQEGAAAAPALGVGIHVEIRMRTDGDEIDDALGADAGFVLDLAEEVLRARGFVLAAATGSSVLGVRALPEGPAARLLGARATALEAAADLHDRIAAREKKDARVHANVTVHADGLAFRAGQGSEIAGGALLRTDAWAPRGDVLALCATTAAIEGITGFDFVPGPDSGATIPLVTVTRRG